LREAFPGTRLETCVNEKTAYEMALAGAWVSKRVACIFSVEGVYEALDPLMTSAYTGVKGGFVIVCIKQTDLDATPLGTFSKLPVLTSDGTPDDLSATLQFAFDLSERHEIPCLIETLPLSDAGTEQSVAAPDGRQAKFVKDPGRWAATPKFRFQLHKALNEKIERIRDEFELYEGNSQILNGTAGVITHRAFSGRTGRDNASVLTLGTIFPLPRKLVAGFIAKMQSVEVREGTYPAIEMQITAKDRIDGPLTRRPSAREAAGRRKAETICGLTVVRDELGPASSINMAHGMASSHGRKGILAVTSEAAFFHSGLPAFVNTLYNGSSYILVIKTETAKGTSDIVRYMEGIGFSGYSTIEKAAEIERFTAGEGLTVLLFEGDL
jgi:TPP-dependent indolepyruvate ferredoxin oxidoreductase alpha subunit